MSYMKPKPPKSRVVDDIDRNLRQAFDDIANEPVPDRFADLLKRLKAGHASADIGDKDDTSDE